jgi:hypothetical protein
MVRPMTTSRRFHRLHSQHQQDRQNGTCYMNHFAFLLSIHSGGDTAFSFHRDLRFHIVHVFIASRHLSTSILTLIPRQHKYRKTIEGEKQHSFTKAVEAVSMIQKTVFPDELAKPWPHISLVQKRANGKQKLTVEFPSSLDRPDVFICPMQIKISFRGDGTTGKFRMPYYTKRGQTFPLS